MLGPSSLRGRITLLFVGFALLPALGVAFILQRRAVDSLDALASRYAMATTAAVASEVDAQVERAFRDAAEAGRRVVAGQRLTASSLPSHGVRSIHFIDSQGVVRGSWFAADTSFSGVFCPGTRAEPFTASRDQIIPGAPLWTVRAALDPQWLLSRPELQALAGEDAIEISDGDAFVTTASACPAAPMGSSEASAAQHSARSVESVPWVVRTGYNVDFGPALFGFTPLLALAGLLVASLATLLFVAAVRDLTRPLRQLTEAADRIGDGDFAAWLPPPGDDEAGRLSFALSSMMTRVDKTMERMKRVGQMAAVGEVASYMTHEIRNPLSSLRLNLQAIERSAGRMKLIASSGRSLEICLKQIDRLEAVASGVLRLSRQDAGGSLDLSWTHAVIRDAAELLQPEFDRRRVTVSLDLTAPDEAIRCDAQRLEAVFINLLLNAAEAMPNGGTIWVQTRGAHLESRNAIGIRVSDSGPGVPEELHSRIFEPFFTTRDGGSGVGLSVSAQTIHDHGGTIHLGPRASVVEGAVFEIMLPLADSVDDQAQNPDAYGWPFAAKPGSPPRHRRFKDPSPTREVK